MLKKVFGTEKVNPPFSPALPSFLINIMILSYWDYSGEVCDLCMDLNHNSRRYYRSNNHRKIHQSMVKIMPCILKKHPIIGANDRGGVLS